MRCTTHQDFVKSYSVAVLREAWFLERGNTFMNSAVGPSSGHPRSYLTSRSLFVVELPGDRRVDPIPLPSCLWAVHGSPIRPMLASAPPLASLPTSFPYRDHPDDHDRSSAIISNFWYVIGKRRPGSPQCRGESSRIGDFVSRIKYAVNYISPTGTATGSGPFCVGSRDRPYRFSRTDIRGVESPRRTDDTVASCRPFHLRFRFHSRSRGPGHLHRRRPAR